MCVGFKVWFGPPSLDRPSPGPPKISLFFSLSRHKIRSFLPSLGVFSLNFGGVFEGRDPQMCTFGLSGCRVEPRRPHQTGPPVPALQTGRREKKARNFGPPTLRAPTFSGFGPPPFGPSGPPPFGPPTYSGFGPPPFGPPPFRPPPFGPPPFGPPLALACMKKTKQLKITKKNNEKNPNNQHKKSKQLKITKKTIKKKSKQLTQKIQTI